jgi:hypothetical protein
MNFVERGFELMKLRVGFEFQYLDFWFGEVGMRMGS